MQIKFVGTIKKPPRSLVEKAQTKAPITVEDLITILEYPQAHQGFIIVLHEGRRLGRTEVITDAMTIELTVTVGGDEMAFLSRFPTQEIPRLARELAAVTHKTCPEEHRLVELAKELEIIGEALAKTTTDISITVEQADFMRDQLVLSLYHGLKMWTHRADLPERQQQAQALLEDLLPEGFAWIDTPYEKQNKRMDLLLSELKKQKELLEEFHFTNLIESLKEAQVQFKKLLKGAKGDHDQYARGTKQKILVNSFHRKLEIFIALVRERYAPRSEQDLLTTLFTPLREATWRIESL